MDLLIDYLTDNEEEYDYMNKIYEKFTSEYKFKLENTNSVIVEKYKDPFKKGVQIYPKEGRLESVAIIDKEVKQKIRFLMSSLEDKFFSFETPEGDFILLQERKSPFN